MNEEKDSVCAKSTLQEMMNKVVNLCVLSSDVSHCQNRNSDQNQQDSDQETKQQNIHTLHQTQSYVGISDGPENTQGDGQNQDEGKVAGNQIISSISTKFFTPPTTADQPTTQACRVDQRLQQLQVEQQICGQSGDVGGQDSFQGVDARQKCFGSESRSFQVTASTDQSVKYCNFFVLRDSSSVFQSAEQEFAENEQTRDQQEICEILPETQQGHLQYPLSDERLHAEEKETEVDPECRGVQVDAEVDMNLPHSQNISTDETIRSSEQLINNSSQGPSLNVQNVENVQNTQNVDNVVTGMDNKALDEHAQALDNEETLQVDVTDVENVTCQIQVDVKIDGSLEHSERNALNADNVDNVHNAANVDNFADNNLTNDNQYVQEEDIDIDEGQEIQDARQQQQDKNQEPEKYVGGEDAGNAENVFVGNALNAVNVVTQIDNDFQDDVCMQEAHDDLQLYMTQPQQDTDVVKNNTVLSQKQDTEILEQFCVDEIQTPIEKQSKYNSNEQNNNNNNNTGANDNSNTDINDDDDDNGDNTMDSDENDVQADKDNISNIQYLKNVVVEEGKGSEEEADGTTADDDDGSALIQEQEAGSQEEAAQNDEGKGSYEEAAEIDDNNNEDIQQRISTAVMERKVSEQETNADDDDDMQQHDGIEVQVHMSSQKEGTEYNDNIDHGSGYSQYQDKIVAQQYQGSEEEGRQSEDNNDDDTNDWFSEKDQILIDADLYNNNNNNNNNNINYINDSNNLDGTVDSSNQDKQQNQVVSFFAGVKSWDVKTQIVKEAGSRDVQMTQFVEEAMEKRKKLDQIQKQKEQELMRIQAEEEERKEQEKLDKENQSIMGNKSDDFANIKKMKQELIVDEAPLQRQKQIFYQQRTHSLDKGEGKNNQDEIEEQVIDDAAPTQGNISLQLQQGLNEFGFAQIVAPVCYNSLGSNDAVSSLMLAAQRSLPPYQLTAPPPDPPQLLSLEDQPNKDQQTNGKFDAPVFFGYSSDGEDPAILQQDDNLIMKQMVQARDQLQAELKRKRQDFDFVQNLNLNSNQNSNSNSPETLEKYNIEQQQTSKDQKDFCQNLVQESESSKKFQNEDRWEQIVGYNKRIRLERLNQFIINQKQTQNCQSDVKNNKLSQQFVKGQNVWEKNWFFKSELSSFKGVKNLSKSSLQFAQQMKVGKKISKTDKNKLIQILKNKKRLTKEKKLVCSKQSQNDIKIEDISDFINQISMNSPKKLKKVSNCDRKIQWVKFGKHWTISSNLKTRTKRNQNFKNESQSISKKSARTGQDLEQDNSKQERNIFKNQQLINNEQTDPKIQVGRVKELNSFDFNNCYQFTCDTLGKQKRKNAKKLDQNLYQKGEISLNKQTDQFENICNDEKKFPRPKQKGYERKFCGADSEVKQIGGNKRKNQNFVLGSNQSWLKIGRRWMGPFL